MPPEKPIQPVQSAQAVPFTLSQTPVPQISYAGFWLRFLALGLDGLILFLIVGIPLGIIQFVVLSNAGPNPTEGVVIFNILLTVLQIVLQFAYFIIFTHRKQATIGKQLLGLRVVSESGTPLSLGTIAFRETIAKFGSAIILGIGYLMTAFTAKKQGLHDMMVSGVVLSNPAERKTWAFVLSIVFAALLPIIAIIGILASITLASLNNARSMGSDASIKANMSSARIQAMIVFDSNNNSYATVCVDPQVTNYFASAEKTAKTKVLCNATAEAYAAYVPLTNKTAPNTGWCTDSISGSRETMQLVDHETVCPK